jgi:hypothetical protein
MPISGLNSSVTGSLDSRKHLPTLLRDMPKEFG